MPLHTIAKSFQFYFKIVKHQNCVQQHSPFGLFLRLYARLAFLLNSLPVTTIKKNKLLLLQVKKITTQILEMKFQLLFLPRINIH